MKKIKKLPILPNKVLKRRCLFFLHRFSKEDIVANQKTVMVNEKEIWYIISERHCLKCGTLKLYFDPHYDYQGEIFDPTIGKCRELKGYK